MEEVTSMPALQGNTYTAAAASLHAPFFEGRGAALTSERRNKALNPKDLKAHSGPTQVKGGFVMSHVGRESSTTTVVMIKTKYRTAMQPPNAFCSFQPQSLMLMTVPKTIPSSKQV